MKPRAVIVLVCLSLALNIFLVGAVAGGWMMRQRAAAQTQAAAPPARGSLLRQASAVLKPESRQAFRQALRAANRDAAPLVAEARASRLDAAEAISAPTFDQATADAALDRARAADMAVRVRLERAAVSAIAALPSAERIALGEAMRQRAAPQGQGPTDGGDPRRKASEPPYKEGALSEDRSMKSVLLALAIASPAVGASAQTPAAAPGAGASAARGAGMFKAADTNGDGVLDKAEWLAAGRREQGFQRIDANQDGKITRDELMAMRAKMQATKGEASKPD